jgi:hypothetical protein
MAEKKKSSPGESGSEDQALEAASSEESEALNEEPTDESVEAPVPAESEKTPTVPLDEAAARSADSEGDAEAEAAPEAPAAPPVLAKKDAAPASKPALDKKDAKPALDKKGDSKGNKSKDAAPSLSKAAPAPAPAAASDDLEWDNRHAISLLFDQPSDERPLSDIVDKIVIDEPQRRAPLFLVFIVLLLGVGSVFGLYASLSEDGKKCFHLEMDGYSCPDYFQAVFRGIEDEAKREAVKNAPRVGRVVLVTSPNGLQVSGDQVPDFINSGAQTLRAQTRIEVQNVPADAPTRLTIEGGVNFQDRTVEILPADDIFNTLWAQNTSTGEFSAEFNFQLCLPGSVNFGASNCIYFQEREVAPGVPAYEEYLWRVRWQPPVEPAEGQPVRINNAFVTVTSNPSGAEVRFNNRPALGADGQPCRTPCTFSTYQAVPEAEDQTPVPINVSEEPRPLSLYLEGKKPAATDIVGHNFLCTPIEGAQYLMAPAEGPLGRAAYDFMGFCNYTQEIHFELSDPAPPAAEGSAE